MGTDPALMPYSIAAIDRANFRDECFSYQSQNASLVGPEPLPDAECVGFACGSTDPPLSGEVHR